MVDNLLSKLQTLPKSLPKEGAICLELQEGIPIFRASHVVQARIETLLEKQHIAAMTLEDEEELEELDAYEAMDDYISLVNRTVRNPSDASWLQQNVSNSL
jgi:hypothetical protein